MSGAKNIVWQPQPGPQAALIECPAPVIFYGGARGGGKTDGVLGKWALKERRYGKHFNAVMLRKTAISAEDAIERSRQIYGPLGGTFNETLRVWRMPNGGRVTFGYLESIKDAERYQGQNLTDAWVEEAGQYADSAPIDRLFGALRSGAGVPPQLILTANPGGAGQHWLRERFGLYPLPSEPAVVSLHVDGGGEYPAAVIPSRLKDNRLLMEGDPDYENRLRMVGSRELVRAWLEGDWSAIEGAYFDEFATHKHVLRPVSLPEHWLRFRAMDWGSARPFAVGWFAVASEDWGHPDGAIVPKGALIQYNEWYGSAGAQNVGLKLDASQVGRGIVERERGQQVSASMSVLDPSAFIVDGGPSIAERMANEGALFRRADNRRVGGQGALVGWDAMRERLAGERPMLYWFSTCRDSIRTIPVLQHDYKRPEDVDTDQEDHCADMCRYACMARPYTRPRPKRKRDTLDKLRFNDLRVANPTDGGRI